MRALRTSAVPGTVGAIVCLAAALTRRAAKLVALAATVLMLVALLPTFHAQASTGLPPYPTVLPPTMFLGLGNGPSQLSWMTTSSGVPWNARYTFLTGGANTGNGWTTWRTPAGAYASQYMNASASAGYLPVFTYEQLVPSLPHTGTTEAAQVVSNLNNASTMRAYFADWKLLMTVSAAVGKPVIVHVEPDSWGYIENTYGDNATAAPAAVASSGFADAAGFGDNAAGFAQALVHMRDIYAPNVILGFNVSPWSSGQDISTSRSSLDVPMLAQKVANFFLSLGANFDLLFYQISSRDAGFDQVVMLDGGIHWWDVSNTTFPNFARFAQWTGSLTQFTGRRGVLWHVPIGNTLYDTLDNTTGHYQDNRVQYLLGTNMMTNLAQFADAGIVGIMFGAGDHQSTSYADAQADGITNPAPTNGNTRVAVVSDDDGGYLRYQAGAYYRAGGLKLP